MRIDQLFGLHCKLIGYKY